MMQHTVCKGIDLLISTFGDVEQALAAAARQDDLDVIEYLIDTCTPTHIQLSKTAEIARQCNAQHTLQHFNDLSD
jgi:hypothetical protein